MGGVNDEAVVLLCVRKLYEETDCRLTRRPSEGPREVVALPCEAGTPA